MLTPILLASCSGTSQEQQEDTSVKEPQMDIHMAIMSDNLGTLKGHIAYGTNLNVKEPFVGSTPLITAIVFDKPEAAMLLIEAGSDLNAKNNDGSTALHVAAFFCRTEVVRALLEKGADKTIKNNFNATPLQSVSAPWKDMIPVYNGMQNGLKPMGLQLDLERIEKTRPKIVALLQ